MPSPGCEEENYSWVEVRGGMTANSHSGSEGLSVLPLWQNSVVLNTTQTKNADAGASGDPANTSEKADKMTQLNGDSRQKPVMHVPIRVDGTRDRVILEGMRSGDDRQDDVFIVELERGSSGLGLGLIDGLVSFANYEFL